jgi:Protein of unknown function (DUF1566)
MSNIKRLLISTTILVNLLLAASAISNTLPATVQNACSDNTGATSSCTDTGQDDRQPGTPWPEPRFIIDSTGNCVTDSVSNLMWVRSPDSIARTLQQALKFANSLEICNSTDWRLPNVNELEYLINSKAANQAGFLNSQGFSNIQADNYWSSSIYSGFDSDSDHSTSIITMANGGLGPIDRYVVHFVLPVRAGK